MIRITGQPATPTARHTTLAAQAFAAAALLLLPASTLCAADMHFSFSYSDPITQAAGVLTARDNRNGTISAFAGTLYVWAGPLAGSYSLLENLTGAAVVLSPMRWFRYDDVLFPGAPALLDVYGLLFADSVREINIGRNRSGPGYSLSSAEAIGYNYRGDSSAFTLTRTDFTTPPKPAPPPPPPPVPGPGVPGMLAGAGMMLTARRRRGSGAVVSERARLNPQRPP